MTKHAGAIIGLLTALVGLVVAVLNVYPQLTKSSEPTPAAQIGRSALTVVVEQPLEGEAVRGEAVSGMGGTFDGTLPPGQQLWVVARDERGNHYPSPATVQVNRQARRWSQASVPLPAPGRWQLQVYLATDAAARTLETSVRQSPAAPLTTLPDGLQQLRAVSVQRP